MDEEDQSTKSAEELALLVQPSRMEPASNVIERLQSGEGVYENNFVVGYAHKQRGLLEIPFVDFMSEYLPHSVSFCQAVPQERKRRIRYFKYKDEKVWDRNERLDNVFGSTGSNMTIIEAMATYEAKRKRLETSEDRLEHNDVSKTIPEANTDDETPTGSNMGEEKCAEKQNTAIEELNRTKMTSDSVSTCIQDDELEELKTSFEGKVKVTSKIGDFSNVVNITLADHNIQLKFQLTADYPNCPPVISIRSPALTGDQQTALTNALSQDVLKQPGKPVIRDLVSSCTRWLLEQAIDTVAITPPVGKDKNKNRKPKSKTKGKEGQAKAPEELQGSSGKKPRMKTAAEVIKRLQWDEGVDKNEFVVGYMDRLEGLLERPFVDFTWKDLTSCDSLAIPEHRIQYFKYKDEKVWDKNERLDNVFGSTGSKVTIIEAVAKYEAKHRLVKEGEDKSDQCGGFATSCPESITANEEATEANTDEESCVGDNHTGSAESDAATGSMSECQADNEKRKGRVNYFIALEIANKNITKRLTQIQTEIAYKFPQYWPYMIKENTFHLTLAALALANTDDEQRCINAMNKVKRRITELAERSQPISFVGVEHWGTRVVFAKVKFTPELMEINDVIRGALEEENIKIDRSLFKPHLTLFKVGRSAKNWIKQWLGLNKYDEVEFGQQDIDNIQVCKMGSAPNIEQGETGFYKHIFKLEITKTSD